MAQREFKEGLGNPEQITVKRADDRKVSLRKKREEQLAKRRGRSSYVCTQTGTPLIELVQQIPPHFGVDSLGIYTEIVKRGNDAYPYFDILFTKDVMSVLVQLLDQPLTLENSETLNSISYLLINIAAHPELELWVPRIIECGALPVVFKHLSITDSPLCENLIHFIANCCLDSVDTRNQCVAMGLFSLFIPLFQNTSITETLLWALKSALYRRPIVGTEYMVPVWPHFFNIFKAIRLEEDDQEQMDMLSYSLDVIARMAQDSAYSLRLFHDLELTQHLMFLLTRNLSHRHIRVLVTIFGIYANIVAFEEFPRPVLIMCAQFLEHPSIDVRVDSSLLLSIILNQNPRFEDLEFFCGQEIFPYLKRQLNISSSHTASFRHNLAWIIVNLTSKIISYDYIPMINYLLENSVVFFLCTNLRTQDLQLKTMLLRTLFDLMRFEGTAFAIEDCDGLSIVESLQNDSNYIVSDLAGKIVGRVDGVMDVEDDGDYTFVF